MIDFFILGLDMYFYWYYVSDNFTYLNYLVIFPKLRLLYTEEMV